MAHTVIPLSLLLFVEYLFVIFFYIFFILTWRNGWAHRLTRGETKCSQADGEKYPRAKVMCLSIHRPCDMFVHSQTIWNDMMPEVACLKSKKKKKKPNKKNLIRIATRNSHQDNDWAHLDFDWVPCKNLMSHIIFGGEYSIYFRKYIFYHILNGNFDKK